MKPIKVKEILIDKENIARRIDQLVDKIASPPTDNLIIIGILKGSFIFLADLMRSLHRHQIHPKIDFLTLSSYGNETTSSKKITIIHDIRDDIKDADILLVDDILDSGYTLNFTKKLLLKRGARSVQTCVLLEKKARREVEFEADYVGFCIDDHFVVGYGLDYANLYRELPYIAKLDLPN